MFLRLFVSTIAAKLTDGLEYKCLKCQPCDQIPAPINATFTFMFAFNIHKISKYQNSN